MIKRAVITGATGAVGTALIHELINHDIEVLVLCREGGRNDRIPNHPLVSVKYCAPERVGSTVRVARTASSPAESAFFRMCSVTPRIFSISCTGLGNTDVLTRCKIYLVFSQTTRKVSLIRPLP